ncbi:MAG: ABC transporter substrate-binding protein [Candidatus Rokubacteria bacterium]|nr:ABC transporter substrate-binding protein [Candidatus Rokubacteria bacterium]
MTRCILAMLSVLLLAGPVGAAEPIKVGVILPFTGGSSIAASEIFSGITLALEEINGAGGVLGRTIELIKEDDESIPTKGVTAAQKLIVRDKVVALIGTYNSAVALPASDIARKAKIPMVTGGSTAVTVTKANTPGDPWFFRHFPGSDEQGTQSAQDVVLRLKKKRLAILYENTTYGKDLEKTFREVTTGAGATIVSSETYNHGDTDFYTQLTKLKSLAPDAVYIAGLVAEGTAILRQARDLGLKTQFVGSGGLMSDKLIELAGAAAEGFAVSTMYEPSTNNLVGAEFGKRFAKRFGVAANTHSALGYDALRVLADAIRRAGSTEGIAIRNALMATKDFETVQGPPGAKAVFDDIGGAHFKIGLGVVKDGKRILMPYE